MSEALHDQEIRRSGDRVNSEEAIIGVPDEDWKVLASA
jgi:hypothetical protein